MKIHSVLNDRQTDRQTDKQTDGQTERQTSLTATNMIIQHEAA